MPGVLSFPTVRNGSVRLGDPLLVAIENLKAGMQDYNDNAPMQTDEDANAYAAISYRGPLRIIERWKQPARSNEGAIAALKLAIQADKDGDYTIVGPMLAAALAYFEQP
jgi:hypothetical protein